MTAHHSPDVDPCLMPVGHNRVCLLPGDHGGGCDEPTEPAARHRCKCSHGPSVHTGGYGRCHLFACACQRYRDGDELEQAKRRHPAGRDLPQTADINDYLRQKGELA
jgi:hypothetical protein